MNYYIITPPKNIDNEIDIACNLLAGYPVTLHLRKPEFSEQQLLEYLKGIPSSLHSKIAIHSHHTLHQNLNIKGIHFTHRNKNAYPDYLNSSVSKSISAHSYNEIEKPIGEFDYYFLSPIFSSTSKPGYGGNAYNPDELKAFLQKENTKNIIALSGVNFNNIKQVKELGFKGAAFLGAFWDFCKNNDYKQQTKLFFNTLNNNTLPQ